MINRVIDPLITTFGLWFVIGTWLFVPSVISGGLLTVVDRPAVAVPTFLVPYAVWPGSLWILKTVYEFVPIRVILGIDVTDLSVFAYLVLIVIVFLQEATEELTGTLER
jgi:hypothetical protein